ncbi:MAG: XRE family transcriptional regulator [Proteobacteria bacterium]|nr:XRE family transcriptional regulator [Pseudomonadota bacterium]
MRKAITKIRECRHQLGLTQHDVAVRLGVTRKLFSRWERGELVVSERYREELARILQCDRQSLEDPAESRSRLHKSVVSLWQRPSTRANYPRGATVQDVLRLGSFATKVVHAAREQLTPEEFRVLSDEFPRDTAHELLLLFMLIASGARLMWTSPALHQCPLLVLDDFLPDYGANQMQWALTWERDEARYVLFSQVRLKAPYVKARARVDFLIMEKKPGKRGQWVFAELDGDPHKSQSSQDEERAEGLLIPELRYDNDKLFTEHWMLRFFRDLERAGGEGARREFQRRREARERRAQRFKQIEEHRRAA